MTLETANGYRAKVGRNGLSKGKERPAVFEDKQWRSVQPAKAVQDALADFRDLCFRPPSERDAPNRASNGGNSPTAGIALVALEALYDKNKMERLKETGHFSDGIDTVRNALATLLKIQDEPQRHMYKPLSDDDAPARNPNISLDSVVDTLLRAIQTDFAPEIDALKKATSTKKGHAA